MIPNRLTMTGLLHRMPGSTFLFTVTALFLAHAAEAGPIEEMGLRTWYQVPDSRLDAVKPDPEPPNWSGFAGLFAWAGGAFDSKRNRLMIWGGGHADYTGNEIYAFDLNTLKWSRIWGPSPDIPSSGTSDTYPDGNPSARHTYDNLAYNPARDVLFSSGGSLSWTGSQTSGTWEFNLETLSWSKRRDAEPSIYTQTAYDPATGLLFRAMETATHEFDPTADTWTKRADSGNDWIWQMSGEIDPDKRVMVLVGGGKFKVFDLRTYAWSSPTPTGDTGILDAYAPGLTWDSESRKLVAWGGGGSVYVIDITDNPKSYVLRKIDPSPGNTVTPTDPNPQGTYSKFQYSSAKNAFVLVNRVNESVFAFRLTAGSGSDIRWLDGTPSRIQVVSGPRGELIVSLPIGQSPRGRLDIFGMDGRRLASIAASTHIRWSPAPGEQAGVVLVVWREGSRTLAARRVLTAATR